MDYRHYAENEASLSFPMCGDKSFFLYLRILCKCDDSKTLGKNIDYIETARLIVPHFMYLTQNI